MKIETAIQLTTKLRRMRNEMRYMFGRDSQSGRIKSRISRYTTRLNHAVVTISVNYYSMYHADKILDGLINPDWFIYYDIDSRETRLVINDIDGFKER